MLRWRIDDRYLLNFPYNIVSNTVSFRPQLCISHPIFNFWIYLNKKTFKSKYFVPSCFYHKIYRARAVSQCLYFLLFFINTVIITQSIGKFCWHNINTHLLFTNFGLKKTNAINEWKEHVKCGVKSIVYLIYFAFITIFVLNYLFYVTILGK